MIPESLRVGARMSYGKTAIELNTEKFAVEFPWA
jgi:hypothetical protein